MDGSEWAHIEEQNPAWSEEDEEMLRRCISATFDHGYLRECDWLKSIKDRVGCEVNCTTTKAWSEDDERKRKRIIGLLEGWLSTFKETCYAEDCKCGIDWLKSLKEKFVDFDKGLNVGFSAAKYNQWKPNDEQMEALLNILPSGNQQLFSLYNDLKKLK